MKRSLSLLALAAALPCGSVVAQGDAPAAPPAARDVRQLCKQKGEAGPAVYADAEGSYTVCIEGFNLNGYHLTLISLTPSGSHTAAYHDRLEVAKDGKFLTYYQLGITGEPGVVALLDPTWYPDTKLLDDEALADAIARSRYAFFIPARDGGSGE